jgi:Fic/DOC family
MEATKRTFSLDEQPEVFASTTRTSRAVQRALSDGRVRKVSGRLYTRNLAEPLEQVVRRNWSRVAAHYFPGSVIVDRSGIEAQPSDDGSLFLDAGPDYAGRRPVRLPGLTLLPRRGPGPMPGDMPHLESLYFSSRPRALLDNLRGSRARRNGVSRTLSRAEVEDELTRTATLRGNGALNELRDEASKVASSLDAEREMATLDDLIGAILGTRDTQLATPAARAAHAGLGLDPRRIELFETLQAALLRDPLEGRAEQPDSLPALAFIEAYFSNWIEGTEFALREAEKIVFRRAVPKKRAEDAHDVLGTFDVVNDPAKRQRLPDGPDDLLDLLRAHHAQMLERRPQADPGAFKTLVNRAGATTFVHPDLVVGTLVEGYRHYEALPAGLSRAIFIMFLIAEVHPFTDGNGRVARVLMNAELSAVGEQRIVIPIVYRDDHLRALRALSRNGNPRPLVRALDFAQEYAAAIDWSDLRTAERTLEETNALVEPELAEERGVRLRLPAPGEG